MTAIDGRTARAVRTREAIVDASIALVDEGDVRPTALKVAERAGVSVRSVFQHFDDLEGLYAAIANRLVDRLGGVKVVVDASLPLPDRINEMVRSRSRLLEVLTPIRRAAAVHAPFSAEVRARLQAGHNMLRAELERVFADELAEREEPARTRLLDSLDTVLSWPSWENLRTLNGRTQEEAQAVFAHMVGALLL
ncbi:MAG TPA: TetR/AcrR family transcriptional regulator [Acidimicrobiales bacterium]|jgi:AcrR family transcriptional regulator|nr:TetR/AcrR family transcriptional regulator [Acidimicrobiales bacterium]